MCVFVSTRQEADGVRHFFLLLSFSSSGFSSGRNALYHFSIVRKRSGKFSILLRIKVHVRSDRFKEQFHPSIFHRHIAFYRTLQNLRSKTYALSSRKQCSTAYLFPLSPFFHCPSIFRIPSDFYNCQLILLLS